MNEDLPAEDTRTEAHRLRSSYFHNGRWENKNGQPLSTDPASLLESLKSAQADADETKSEEEKARKKRDDSLETWRTRSAHHYSAETHLNIIKMALADALEIPR